MNNEVIVVGTDGSDESWTVLDWAVGRAKVANAQLQVLVAYNLPSLTPAGMEGGYLMVDDGKLRDLALETAQKACDYAKERGVEATSVVQPGDPAALLLEASNEASLLVIGTTGSQGIADRFLGSVSASLPAKSKCPVVVVPKFEGGSPFTPVKKIVVGVDGSDTALTALRKAVDETELWGAKLQATSAVPFATGNHLMAWMTPSVDRKRVMHDIRVGLDVSVDQVVGDRDIQVGRHVLDGNPAELLSEFSTAVDLIVVGRRGRGGFAGLLLGSTSHTLLARTTCPVMVVPQEKLEKLNGGATAPWNRA
ncbi:universal stress protein [Boudabousia tangfeifanii]|uniref:Universal stress protein n=1 Tax=Boudabousia tangfeifanii TaxID=1912795 RepID=A0A1D9MLA3_9ACTO|nr:universal stress protein [Boudabousia tangfeifanii]AOZ72969.1 universal stress protein [Boudabousia tangfeifanii]